MPRRPAVRLITFIEFRRKQLSPMSLRIRRLLLQTARLLCRTLLRTVASSFIFLCCLLLVARYLGLPVPSLADMLERCKSVSELADILS